MNKHRFPYKWKIADGYPSKGKDKHGRTVFGTFICGGGSTMGYKLAGYDHLGGVEIEEKIAAVYKANHNPKHLYACDIRLFKEMAKEGNLPPELYNLDLFDGSPPCSSFSISGNREDDWGKEKKFNEGQEFQRLDDLFFDYIDIVGILKPKGGIAENVTGLVAGNARAYVKEICIEFDKIGYDVQIFRLSAASMGVPQKRERIFFIYRRRDLKLPTVKLSFAEPGITFAEVEASLVNPFGKPLSDAFRTWWEKCSPGDCFDTVHPNKSFFNTMKLWKNRVCPTVTSTVAGKVTHYDQPVEISDEAYAAIGSFPTDFNYMNVDTKYLIGMSVPPVMMANVSYCLYEQWFKQN